MPLVPKTLGKLEESFGKASNQKYLQFLFILEWPSYTRQILTGQESRYKLHGYEQLVNRFLTWSHASEDLNSCHWFRASLVTLHEHLVEIVQYSQNGPANQNRQKVHSIPIATPQLCQKHICNLVSYYQDFMNNRYQLLLSSICGAIPSIVPLFSNTEKVHSSTCSNISATAKVHLPKCVVILGVQT